MAPGSPELRLNVTFDIDHFKRVALQGLADAASKTTLDIGVQFNRDDITREMVSLGRQLGLRKYRVDFEIKNIETALAHVKTLSTALDALNRKTSAVKAPSQPSIAAGPSGGGTIARSRFDSPVISTGQVAAIYKAAADASLLEFNKAIVGNKRQMAAELSAVAKDSIAGLVNALAAGKGQVGDAFANLGAEGLKRIKDRLGIESPSKEMEQIGKWAGKGYELGFIKSLEEANLAIATVIGKSLRKMDGMVAARQRASRQFAPGEDTNQTKVAQLEKQLQSLQKTRDEIIKGVNKPGLSYEEIDKLSQAFDKVNAEITRTNSLIDKFQSKKPNVPFLRTQERLGTALGRREQLQTAAQVPQLRAAAGTYTEGSLQNINKLLQAAQLLAAELVPNTKEWGQAQSEIARLNHKLKQSGELANKIQLQHNLGKATVGSISYLETKLQLLKNIAKDIVPNEGEWNKINKQIQHTERSLEKLNRKPLSGKDRMGAAGGAFLYGGGMSGGIGSAGLGVAGGLVGGVPGAFAGAAAGQVVDNALAGAAAMAKQYSELQKMQRGLAIASIDAKDFAEAQGLVASISTRLLLPLADASKYYAQLRINTKQYNISAKETSQILEGTVNAVRATGGSLEDVEGAMRAVVQIFSKGGVQAEELRGQLGERFPGAVIKFAQANKITFEELQKQLEAGTVGIGAFVAFAKSNFTDYAEFSKQLATAPEYAGDRLKIAFEKLQIAIGGLIGPAGAQIQDFATAAVKSITNFVTNNKLQLGKMAQDFATTFTGIGSVVLATGKFIIQVLGPVFDFIASIIREIRIATGVADAASSKVEMTKQDRIMKENYAEALKYNNLRAKIKTNTATAQEQAQYLLAPPGETESIKYLIAQKRYQQARKQFKDAGGNAALQPPGQLKGLVFGGAGANMPLTREPKDEAAKGAEAFAKLQDDLAKTYNDAEIARIKQRYELQKQLAQDQFDMQEYGANRLQKQNLSLIRGLINAEITRKEAVQNAQLDVQKQAGKVAGGVSGGIAGLTQYITGDPNQKGYQADHGTIKNYHDHLAFNTRKAAEDAYKQLMAEGIKVTEFKGYGSGVTGPHSGAGSLHHQGLAFDVPGAQWGGSGAIGAKEYAGSARVRQVLGMGGQVSAGSRRAVKGNEKRDVMAEANTAIATGVAQQATLDASITKTSATMREFARYAAEAYNVPELQLSNDLLKRRNDLTEQGMSPENIDYNLRLYEIEQQRAHLMPLFEVFAKAMKMTDSERTRGLEYLSKVLATTTTEEKRKNDETLRGLRIAKLTALDDQLAMSRALTPDAERRVRIQQENPGQTVEFQNQLFDREKTLEASQKLKEQLTGIASAIGDSFGNAFKGIITGSMTAQEALAGFFQSLSDYFADMVSKMIADWLRVEALNGLKSLLGGLGGMLGGGGGGGVSDLFGAGAPDAVAGGGIFSGAGPYQFATGGIATGGFQAFATGGIVTGPTLGLVGEGRYNEAVIPLPDGKSVPVDLGGEGARLGGNGGVSVGAVNITVQNTGDTLSPAAQKQIAGQVQGIVLATMADQRRSGGLLR